MSNAIYKSQFQETRVVLPRFVLVALCICLLSIWCDGCSYFRKKPNVNTATPSSPILSVTSTPPYPTKEPETYQARYVTSVEFGGTTSPLAGVIGAMKKEIFVARDGASRRQDFEVVPGNKISYIENAQGKFVCLPAKQIYSPLDTGSKSPSSDSTTPFSLDRLITQQHDGSVFEKLGTDTVNGKTATKYRVSPATAQKYQGATTETIVWVDMELGMPVKSITTTRSKTGEETKYTLTVEDLQNRTDPSLFQIPSDYKRVEYSEIRAQMYGNSTVRPPSPAQSPSVTGK